MCDKTFTFDNYFLVAQLVANPPVNVGDTREAGSIPGLGDSFGEGNGNLLQYYCLENSVDREAWQTTVRETAKSQTRLSAHAHLDNYSCSNLYS